MYVLCPIPISIPQSQLLDNILKTSMNKGSRTSNHDSDYSEEQDNGETKAGGWVTQVGGAVTLDQLSILSAAGSLENN